MIRTLIRALMLLGLGLSLTACAQHRAPQANCFNFRGGAAQASSSAPSGVTPTVSSMGTLVTRSDTGCDFVLLGSGT